MSSVLKMKFVKKTEIQTEENMIERYEFVADGDLDKDLKITIIGEEIVEDLIGDIPVVGDVIEIDLKPKVKQSRLSVAETKPTKATKTDLPIKVQDTGSKDAIKEQVIKENGPPFLNEKCSLSEPENYPCQYMKDGSCPDKCAQQNNKGKTKKAKSTPKPESKGGVSGAKEGTDTETPAKPVKATA